MLFLIWKITAGGGEVVGGGGGTIDDAASTLVLYSQRTGQVVNSWSVKMMDYLPTTIWILWPNILKKICYVHPDSSKTCYLRPQHPLTTNARTVVLLLLVVVLQCFVHGIFIITLFKITKFVIVEQFHLPTKISSLYKTFRSYTSHHGRATATTTTTIMPTTIDDKQPPPTLLLSPSSQSVVSHLEDYWTQPWNVTYYRTPKYDVYLPTKTNPLPATTTTTTSPTLSTPSSKYQDTAKRKKSIIMLFPGALVPHVAYSNVASYMVEKQANANANSNSNGNDGGGGGSNANEEEECIVVVMSFEPFRLATQHFGADVRSIQNIMKRIERELTTGRYYNNKGNKYNVGQQHQQQQAEMEIEFEWTLMGHSLGAFAAMRLFRDFMMMTKMTAKKGQKTNNINENENKNKRIPNVRNRLVLWAVAPFADMATDLTKLDDVDVITTTETTTTTTPTTTLPSPSSLHAASEAAAEAPKIDPPPPPPRRRPCRILVVQASDDYLAKLLSDDKDRLESNFPNIIRRQSHHRQTYNSRVGGKGGDDDASDDDDDAGTTSSPTTTTTSTTIIETIEGGTHDGFGNYKFPSPQSSSSSPSPPPPPPSSSSQKQEQQLQDDREGEEEEANNNNNNNSNVPSSSSSLVQLSPTRQQEVACDLTLDFLESSLALDGQCEE